MNRRAFLLGAIAAPVIAPVVAKAAAPRVVGWDLARGADATARVQMMVGERGAEMVIPRVMSEEFGLPLGTVRNFRIVRTLGDGEEVAWTGAGKVVDVLEHGPFEISVDVGQIDREDFDL